MRTIDPNSAAVLPGSLKLTRRAYARYFARSRQQELALYLGTFVPCALARRLRFGGADVRPWLEVKEHLAYGCVCPAQIVDLRAQLVATFVNLNARGEGSIPAVKLRREPLHLLPERLRAAGARLACVSLFYANARGREGGYWTDFSPLPVDCLVPDEATCEATRQRLSALAWQALDLALAQVRPPFAEGLQHVDVPHDIVWNAF